MSGEDSSRGNPDQPAGEILPRKGSVDDARSALEQLTPEIAAEIVQKVEEPGDFSLAYDASVDRLEELYVETAFGSLRELKPNEAIEHLTAAEHLRTRHLQLLEAASSDPNHELHGKFPFLRDYAQEQLSLIEWLMRIAEALTIFRQGEWKVAIEALDEQAAHPQFEDPEVLSLMSAFVGATGEALAGEIRMAVQDFGGARAAFDRSVSLFERAGEIIKVEEPDAPESSSRYVKAASLRAQLAQLLQGNDFHSAEEVARSAATTFSAAADDMIVEDPRSQDYLAPIVKALSAECLAVAAECQAELALEEGEWDSASGHAKEVVKLFNDASKECLKSMLPVARVSQERMLNTGFNWSVQFRRRLDREKKSRDRYEEVQRELQEFYASLRGALSPAGVTVNTTAELVSSVHQQVETITRIESQVRSTLQEVPRALDELDLPQEVRKGMETEALELAESSETGAGYLERVGRFVSRLREAAAKAGETAGHVSALIQALSLLT